MVTGTENWAEASGRRLSGVTQVVVNPAFNSGTGEDDASLLVLGSPTPAQPIPLASATDSVSGAPGSVVVMAGWGMTDPSDASSTANILQWSSTVVQDGPYCQKSGGLFNPTDQLCTTDAPYYDTSACFGDSGGPLIANELVGQAGNPTEVGILRSVTGQCDTTGTDVYTPASVISGWAYQVVAAAADDAPSSLSHAPTAFSYLRFSSSRYRHGKDTRSTDAGIAIRNSIYTPGRLRHELRT